MTYFQQVPYTAIPFSAYYIPLIDAFIFVSTVLIITNGYNLRGFHLLPVRQVGSFSVTFTKIQFCFSVGMAILTILICVALMILHTISDEETTIPLNNYRITWALVYLPTLIYVIYSQHCLYREVCRRTSLIHITSHHPNVDYYNAEQLCREFKLAIFPVKTYEDIHRERPDTTSLSLLRTKLILMQQYRVLYEEVSSCTPHLVTIEKTYLPIRTVQS